RPQEPGDRATRRVHRPLAGRDTAADPGAVVRPGAAVPPRSRRAPDRLLRPAGPDQRPAGGGAEPDPLPERDHLSEPGDAGGAVPALPRRAGPGRVPGARQGGGAAGSGARALRSHRPEGAHLPPPGMRRLLRRAVVWSALLLGALAPASGAAQGTPLALGTDSVRVVYWEG